MSLGLKQQVAGPRDESMSGGSSTRGFWTKRRKSATSLMAAIALLAGIAVAYKLFDQTVPNNVVRDASNFAYTITAKDLAAGDPDFRPVTGIDDQVIFRQTLADCDAPGSEACQVSTYPGDGRRTDVIIKNTQLPAHAAGWQVYVDKASVVVQSYNKTTNSYATVTPGTPLWNKYVGFWKLGVQKQTYYPWGNNEYENNPSQNDSYTTACSPAGLLEIDKENPCKLGTIKGAGSQGAEIGPTFPKRDLDDRQYRFTMSEEDEGDQSAFHGWTITFPLVFTARVPAETEENRHSSRPF